MWTGQSRAELCPVSDFSRRFLSVVVPYLTHRAAKCTTWSWFQWIWTSDSGFRFSPSTNPTSQLCAVGGAVEPMFGSEGLWESAPSFPVWNQKLLLHHWYPNTEKMHRNVILLHSYCRSIYCVIDAIQALCHRGEWCCVFFTDEDNNPITMMFWSFCGFFQASSHCFNHVAPFTPQLVSGGCRPVLLRFHIQKPDICRAAWTAGLTPEPRSFRTKLTGNIPGIVDYLELKGAAKPGRNISNKSEYRRREVSWR